MAVSPRGNGVGHINSSHSMMSKVSTEMGDEFAGTLSCHVISHLDQLSLLPSAGLEISTDHSAVMLCSRQVKAGMAHSTCGLNVRAAGKTV